MAGVPRFLNNVSLGQLAIVVTLLGTTASGMLYVGSAVWNIGQSVQSIQDQLSTDADARTRLSSRVREGLVALADQERLDVRTLNQRLDTITAAVLNHNGKMAP